MKTVKEVLDKFALNRNGIEKTVDTLFEKNVKNLFLIGCGGTYSLMMPWKYYADAHTDFPVYAEIGPELILQNHKQLGKDSVCIFCSASGDTRDIVKTMEYCREKKAYIISFLTRKDCPMAQLSNDVFLCDEDNDFTLFFCGIANVLLRMMFLRGEFEKYERFADQMYNIGEALDRARAQTNSRCIYHAARNWNAPWHFVIGSGATWGEAYSYAMCIMEEMQWMHTKSVNAAEFFHGAIELAEKDIPAILLMGEDPSRPLTQRVYDFLKPLSNEILLLDTKEVELPVDDEFRAILSPTVAASMTKPLSKAFEVESNHSLSIRRYYRQMNY